MLNMNKHIFKTSTKTSIHTWRAIFEITLHFEREIFKLPFPMKHKQPFKFIPCLIHSRGLTFIEGRLYYTIKLSVMNYSGCRVEAKLGPWDAHLGLLVRDWQSYVKHLYFFKPWGQTFKTSSLSPLGWFGLIPEIRSWPTHPFALCSPDFISPFVPPLDLPTCGVCVIAHPHLLVWITSEWRVLTNGSLAKIALKVPPCW